MVDADLIPVETTLTPSGRGCRRGDRIATPDGLAALDEGRTTHINAFNEQRAHGHLLRQAIPSRNCSRSVP